MAGKKRKRKLVKPSKTLQFLAIKQISAGAASLSTSEQNRLVAAGGGGFSAESQKKTEELARGKKKK